MLFRLPAFTTVTATQTHHHHPPPCDVLGNSRSWMNKDDERDPAPRTPLAPSLRAKSRIKEPSSAWAYWHTRILGVSINHALRSRRFRRAKETFTLLCILRSSYSVRLGLG